MKKIILFLLILLSSRLSGQSEQFMLPNEDFSSDRNTIDFMPQDEINWLNSIKNQLILDKTDSTKNLLMEVIKIHRFSYLLKYEIAKLLVEKKQNKEIYLFLLNNLEIAYCTGECRECTPVCFYPVIDVITLDSSFSKQVLFDLIDNKNQHLCEKYSNIYYILYAIFPKLIETSKIDIKLISKSLQSNNNSKCKEKLLQYCTKKY